jgi:hypothetical protein
VEGIGGRDAWGTSLPATLEAWQALATQRVAEQAKMEEEDQDEAS